MSNNLIKGRIVNGIADKTLKDRTLWENKMILDKCIKMCKASELAEIQLRTHYNHMEIDKCKNQARASGL